MRRDRGFALLIVLWSLVLITLLLTQVTAAGRSEAALASNLRRAAILRAQTDGAIYTAVFHLLDPASFWAADGATHLVRLPGANIEVRVSDEAGKANPNHVSPAFMNALLRAVGASSIDADRVASEIVQWRYPSAQAIAASPNAQRYRAAGLAYAPPSADFQSIAELGLVLGMTPGLLSRLEPHLTVFTDTDPDPRLGDPAVVRAFQILGAPSPPGSPPPPRAVTITAVASGPDGSHFARSAVVSLGFDQQRQPFRIVAWSAPPL